MHDSRGFDGKFVAIIVISPRFFPFLAIVLPSHFDFKPNTKVPIFFCGFDRESTMDFDPDVATWVLESYLRQPLDYKTLDSVLNSLPFPRENPKLQKLVLLKKLESEVSERPVSETTLELMERLEEVAAASDAMRRAYCAAAVDCTLRRVNIGGYEFFERVKRVWRSRIGTMKKNAAERGLGSDLLWEWKEMMETAVFDDGVAESVLKKFEGVCAVEAVMVYLREETEKMTPSFLELVADATKIDSVLQKIMGVNMIQPVAEVAASGSNSNKGEIGKVVNVVFV